MRLGELYAEAISEIASEPHCGIDISPVKEIVDKVEEYLEEIEIPAGRWKRIVGRMDLITSRDIIIIALEKGAKREGGVTPLEERFLYGE
jgi:uncharacterized protein with PhoU and TrkA domain